MGKFTSAALLTKCFYNTAVETILANKTWHLTINTQRDIMSQWNKYYNHKSYEAPGIIIMEAYHYNNTFCGYYSE